MPAVNLFTGVDDWFAERGYTRHGKREPVWVKQLPHNMQLLFCTEPNKVTKDIYETRFGFAARYPGLAPLHKKLRANSSSKGPGGGPFSAVALEDDAYHNLFRVDYDPIEASGTGPLWDAFLPLLDAALPQIEDVITRHRDYRPDVAESPIWEISKKAYAEIFTVLHVEDFDHAMHLIETNDWHAELNPSNIADEPGKLTIDEEVERAKTLLTDYITTHKED